MDTAIIIFLILVSLIIIFSIIVFVYEMIREHKKSAQAEKADSEASALAASAAALAASAAALAKFAETPVTWATAEEEPVEEEVVDEEVEEEAVEEVVEEEAAEEPVEETEIAATESDNNVAFNAAPAPTHEEKYAELSEEARGWYDEIAQYAAAVEGAKQYVCKRYEEYTLKGRKIVRLMIKRGVTVCEFVLRNNDFDTYVTENKVNVSAAPTSMKVTGAEIIDAAKGAIDIVVRGIYDELELKRRLANERRRAKRAAAAAEAAELAEAQVETEEITEAEAIEVGAPEETQE